MFDLLRPSLASLKALMSTSTDSAIEKRNIRLRAILFVLVGLLGFVTTDVYLTNPSWKHFGESLAAALFIFGLVTVFLELRDFTRYVSRILQEQLLDHRYIRTLGPDRLKDLKRTVDESIIGASELGSRGGFYEFVGQHAETVLRMPYRGEMVDVSRFCIVPGNDELFLKETVTKYTFVKGFSGPSPMVISWGGRWLETPHPFQELSRFRELALSVECESLKLNKKFKLHSADASRKVLVSDDGEEITVKYVKDDSIKNLVFNLCSFEYEIPGSRSFAPEEEVRVEIRDSSIASAVIDDNYFVRLKYPTRNVTVTCVFPDGVTTTASAFGSLPLGVQPLVQGGNVATVTLENWSLPGHGAYIAWQLPPNWKQTVAASKSDNLSETEKDDGQEIGKVRA